MAIYRIFDGAYKHIISDEIMLRNLFYMPEHKDDDITIITEERPKIIGGLNDQIYSDGATKENYTSMDIINRVVKMRKPNENDLKIDDPQCCIYVYLDTFEYNVSKTGVVNYYVFTQNINFDIYVHEDFNNVDLRLHKLIDRLIFLFNVKAVGGVGSCVFAGSSKLDNIDGYEGMQVKFSTLNSVS